jgi:transketolase
MIEKKLRKLAYESRILTLKIFYESGQGGHLGGAFSSAEILTVLYNGILKIDPKNPKWKLRDHFILSKGHIAAMFASVLALRGFFQKDKLSDYDQLDGAFGMHTTLKIPGCDFATGSLGHGLGVGVGAALAKKLNKINSRVFILMGDGELNEGTIWEAAMAANKYKLDNLIIIIDRNMLSMDGNTEDIMPLEPLEDKWSSFGWAVKVVDGHNVLSLYETLKSIPFNSGKPSCIIAKTIKGKGLPSMEGNYKCHYLKISDSDFTEYLKILENTSV